MTFRLSARRYVDRKLTESWESSIRGFSANVHAILKTRLDRGWVTAWWPPPTGTPTPWSPTRRSTRRLRACRCRRPVLRSASRRRRVRGRPRWSDRVGLEVFPELLAVANMATGKPRRSVTTSVTRSPSSPRTWSSLPHSGGDDTPGGGGATYGFIVANSLPMKPSGVQLSRPIVPPGRHTRMSSSAAC